MITGIRGFVMHNNLWPWPISPRSFSHDFAIKLLKYGTSCCVQSTTRTVLNGFFPYWAQMITSMSGWVVRDHLWPWHISSRSFSHHFVIKLLKYGTSSIVHSSAWTALNGFFSYSHICSLALDSVLIGQRSISQGSVKLSWLGWVYPSRSLMYNF